MEIIFISTFGLLVSAIFLEKAPMHDIVTALQYEKLRNKNGN